MKSIFRLKKNKDLFVTCPTSIFILEKPQAYQDIQSGLNWKTPSNDHLMPIFSAASENGAISKNAFILIGSGWILCAK